jgi:Asp-tRNA(Asn)/Glu-tRNA(Gln) amidotransferase A subunit family amidase
MLRGLLDAAAGIDVETYDAARRITKRARQALVELMADADAILTPSAPGAAPYSLASTGAAIFNRLWTLMGTPCVNIPGYADETGLPLGVQIVGRFGVDRGALEAARFMELAMARQPSTLTACS